MKWKATEYNMWTIETGDKQFDLSHGQTLTVRANELADAINDSPEIARELLRSVISNRSKSNTAVLHQMGRGAGTVDNPTN